ncbi:mucin-2 isoform X2 [Schistocerca gregaria]|uniref:mucin-2 isoform X2 n=1 Tax=Schistocerca gregaria TaxID=7010 RepID=UPI00211EE527|nr:mucin-2 isoform X2 [Schistocerca gregaria]
MTPKIVQMMARLLWLALLLHGGLASQNAAKQGRKLFGGYRIVPKACRSPEMEPTERGVCMFNLECTQRLGTVVGTCVDGFLFGTCCRLPPDADELALPDDIPAEDVLNAADAPPPPSPAAPPPPPPPPPGLFDGLLLTPAHMPQPQPPPDTVLVHQNGSHVHDSGDLQDLFEPATHYNVSGPHEPETDILFDATRPEPELSTFSYVGSNAVAADVSHPQDGSPLLHTTEKSATTAGTSYSTAGTSKSTSFSSTYYSSPGLEHTPENKLTTQPLTPGGYITLFSTTTSPIADSTTPGNVPPSQPDNDDTRLTYSSPKLTTASDSYSSTRKATTKPVFTTAVHYTFRQETTTRKLTPDDDGMVQIATISADDKFTKPPMSTSITSNNADSINQIITMLNETGLDILDPQPEPLPEVTLTSTASSGQQSGLSTWVSVDEKPQWASHNTPSPTSQGTESSSKKPLFSSTTYYTTKTTSRPSIYTTSALNFPEKDSVSPIVFPTLQEVPLTSVPTHSKPPAPTVIVLSPPNSAYTTQNFPTVHISTRRPPPYTFYTPPADEVTSELVTKKPSFSQRPSTSTVTKLESTTVKVPPVTSRPPTTVTVRPISSHVPTIAKRPPTVTAVTGTLGTTTVTKRPTTYSTSTEYDQVTSIADLVNFPPVRNPQLNMSVSQQETLQVVLATEPSSEPSHEVPLVPDDNDITTPEFVEDEKFDDKMQAFVNKIVQSLQGNFQDLEEVIYRPRNVTTVAPPVAQSTTRRPTRRPTQPGSTTRRPTRRPTTGSTTRRPATAAAVAASTTRRPSATPTRRPSTPNRRPTTASTTRRPSSSQSTTRVRRAAADADGEDGTHRGRQGRHVRRVAVAGAGARDHVAWPLHQEQVRRRPHHQQVRHHGRPLPARVPGKPRGGVGRVRYHGRAGVEAIRDEERAARNRSPALRRGYVRQRPRPSGNGLSGDVRRAHRADLHAQRERRLHRPHGYGHRLGPPQIRGRSAECATGGAGACH